MADERPQSISSRFVKLAQQFRDKEFRDTYVAAHTRRFLARQMRKFRGDLSQMEFADRLGKQQTIVSRLENPNYSGWTLSTLLEIANKLNVGLIVRFVDFPSFLKFTDDFSESAVHPASYQQESVDDFARIESDKETLKELSFEFDNLVVSSFYEPDVAAEPLPTTWNFACSNAFAITNLNLNWAYNTLLPKPGLANVEISQIAALKKENVRLKEENEELKIQNKRLRAAMIALINPMQSAPFIPQKGEAFPIWSQQSLGGAWQ